MNTCRPLRLLLLAALLPMGSVTARAQRVGGGRMGGGMGMSRAGRMGGGPAMGGRGAPVPSGTVSGRWWDNRKTAKSLGLKGEQQKRMDTVFSQNRDVLQQRYDTFLKAQGRLDALKRSNNPSETALFTEIQHTSQARAELEQAYTHMQLQIRGELTPEQVSRLEEEH